MARAATTSGRTRSSSERHAGGRNRDETARNRDETARNRDETAVVQGGGGQGTAVAGGDTPAELGEDVLTDVAAATTGRAAAAVRAKASDNRKHASADRDVSALRREPTSEIDRELMDVLSDAYGRRIGNVLLGHEIERARGVGGVLTLGIVTLGEVTQAEECHNGDSVRASRDQHLFLALEAGLRSYDPIVRWSEEEFVCALAGEVQVDVGDRLEKACSDFAERYPGVPITVGLAMLEDDDILDSLVERARRASR